CPGRDTRTWIFLHSSQAPRCADRSPADQCPPFAFWCLSGLSSALLPITVDQGFLFVAHCLDVLALQWHEFLSGLYLATRRPASPPSLGIGSYFANDAPLYHCICTPFVT